ncbi:glycosyltransferase family 2 protein [Candidatus Gottesmanbacteria bacterium]|nr:glycosyltransferase family 2 protein [Candidatus Gottesmanbacteria bacterium]
MNQNETTISTVIIAKNEEARIERCLNSLAWTDEILVIDNGSTDTTVTIAKRLGAKVLSAPGRDFSGLRNFGKEKARGEWIVYVDADEIIPQALSREILGKIKSKDPVGFFIRRKNYYMGQLWPHQDKMQRLFLKSKLVGWYGAVHETAQVSGSMGTLAHPLEHDTHRTLEEMVEKTNEWSKTEAKLRFDMHHPAVIWWRLLRVMMSGFWQSYVREGGWRAGTVGLIESMYQGYSMFITYAKLWELQQK